MTFPLDDIFPEPRPATFGKRRGSEGIVWHTTEAPGTSRTSAVGTAVWQRTNPGSYNWILYDPASSDAKGGALLTVPFLEASGGLGTDPATADRAPWLDDLLSAGAMADPNAFLLNVAFSGRTADLAANINRADVVRMIDVAARLTIWVERQAWAADNQVFSGHMHWQSNRSDPGQHVIDAILARYAQLTSAPVPAPEPLTRAEYKALYAAELQKVEDLRTKLRSARRRIARKDAHIADYPA
jgi:hypothetical protein